jgi:hypothetical protein
VQSKARQVVKDLPMQVRKLGVENRHRIGEELDGWEGPPAREVHKDICLGGDYEIHYEIIPAYDIPTLISVIRASDTRQDR